MNTFMETLTNATNFDRTANGALAHKSTNSKVYDMFALGGAYRKRTDGVETRFSHLWWEQQDKKSNGKDEQGGISDFKAMQIQIDSDGNTYTK